MPDRKTSAMALEVPDVAADWPTYYGIRLSDVGEDGEIVVLGHHEDDTRRVVAALNRHARVFWGEPRGLDGDYEETTGLLLQRWARFMVDCEDPKGHAFRVEQDGACWKCGEIADAEWFITWAAGSGDPGAFPVTLWSP